MFEPDEFDHLAQSSGPVGVHRAPRPWWSKVLPPLIAFVIAGLVAYGIAMILWNLGQGGDDEAEPSVTVTASADPSAEPTTSPSSDPSTSPSDEPSSSPTPTPTESPEPEPVIEYGAQVHVRNGAGIQGLAGEQQAELEAVGYTNLAANNISSSLIPNGVNTVVYGDDALADTAQDIADTLGIDAVQGGGTPGGAEIEVLLASNPG